MIDKSLRLALLAAAAMLTCRAAEAQSGLYLYVPNASDNSVSVYSTNADATLTPVTTLSSIGVAPYAAAVRGDQAFAYVTLPGDSAIKVIDTSSQSVVQTVSLGLNHVPLGVAVSPDGTKVYVADALADSVFVYAADPSTGQLTFSTSISTGLGSGPFDLAFKPDGSRLYVVYQNTDHVDVIDTSSDSVLTTIHVGTYNYNVAVSPDGARAYVTNPGSNTVSVIDTSNNSVVATPGSGPAPFGVAVSPDGQWFYAANAETISQYSTSTNLQVAPDVSSGLGTYGLVVNADSTVLFATNEDDNDVATFTIDPATGALTAASTIAAGPGPTIPGMCRNLGAPMAFGGTFTVRNAGALTCAGSTLTFGGGTLRVSGSGLSAGATARLLSGGGTIDTNGNSFSLTSTVSGTGGLAKIGAGILTLSGVNSYTGTTTVGAGTLLVDGSTAAASAVTVASGATLGGPGMVNGPVTVTSGGTLSPGNSPGLLGTGPLTLSPGSTMSVKLNGTGTGQYSRVDVTGAVSIAGSTLSTSVGFMPAIGTVFTIISNDAADAVSGTFAGLPEGAAFLLSGMHFQISYAGGDGNDVTVTAIKHPQAIAFGGLADKMLGGPSFSISATASSGLTVVFSSTTSGVCAVSSSTVTLLAQGLCTIAADQAGDASYSAAPEVTQSFAVNVATQPRMSLDQPGEAAVIPSMTPFFLAGWALDLGAGAGAGITGVHLWAYPIVNGLLGAPVFLGAAGLNLPRSDVGAVYGSQFNTSGWSLTAGDLPAGQYLIAAQAKSAVTGTFNDLQTVTITSAAPGANPVVAVDTPHPFATFGPSLLVTGWTIDAGASSGTGVDAVHVWAYPFTGGALGTPVFLGTAGLGFGRADVAGIFGAQFGPSGYALQSSGLAPGPYRLLVFAHSTVSGLFNPSSFIDVTVAAAATQNPWMAVENPPANSTQQQPFLTTGWALDFGAAAGPGVDMIHVWATRVSDGTHTFLGAASYGSSRSDVAALFGSSFASSGYSLTVTGLAPGQYDITVFAHSTVTGTFNQMQTVRVNVN